MDTILDKVEHRTFGLSVRSHRRRSASPFPFLRTGVLLYEMTFGYRPFEHVRDNYDKMSHIARLADNPAIPSLANAHLSDLIEQCLQINPSDRPSAEELLQHPFFDYWFSFHFFLFPSSPFLFIFIFIFDRLKKAFDALEIGKDDEASGGDGESPPTTRRRRRRTCIFTEP